MTDLKKKPPVAATTEGQSKTLEAIDNGHIAHRKVDDNSLVTFRADNGETWKYRGKRARVLSMLAKRGEGVTQHDTYPWHTRLGGTVHAMRQDGLAITTETEGRYRHARYRLKTRGRLIEQNELKEVSNA